MCLNTNNSLFNDRKTINICKFLLTIIYLPYTLEKLLTSL